MKIQSLKVDFSTGEIAEEKEEVRVKNFNDGEAAVFFRQFLLSKGYKDNIGTIVIDRKRYGKLQYITLFEKPIKVKFAMWRAKKDTDTGKAVLWIGEKNSAGYVQAQVDYGIVVNDRIVTLDVLYYAVIVTPREFRVGTNLKDMPFVDYLLIPLEDIIEQLKKTGRADFDIRKEHREKYAFDKTIDQLKHGDTQNVHD